MTLAKAATAAGLVAAGLTALTAIAAAVDGRIDHKVQPVVATQNAQGSQLDRLEQGQGRIEQTLDTLLEKVGQLEGASPSRKPR